MVYIHQYNKCTYQSDLYNKLSCRARYCIFKLLKQQEQFEKEKKYISDSVISCTANLDAGAVGEEGLGALRVVK